MAERVLSFCQSGSTVRYQRPSPQGLPDIPGRRKKHRQIDTETGVQRAFVFFQERPRTGTGDDKGCHPIQNQETVAGRTDSQGGCRLAGLPVRHAAVDGSAHLRRWAATAGMRNPASERRRFRTEYSHLRRALVELSVDSRKTLQHNSELCAAADNEEDAVRSASLKGFVFLDQKMVNPVETTDNSYFY